MQVPGRGNRAAPSYITRGPIHTFPATTCIDKGGYERLEKWGVEVWVCILYMCDTVYEVVPTVFVTFEFKPSPLLNSALSMKMKA